MDVTPPTPPDEPGPFPPAAPPALVPFSIGSAFSIGWNGFSTCYGPLLGATALALGIGIVTGLAGLVVPLADLVLGVLVGWPLYPGAAYVGITACRDGYVRVEDLFAGFQCYGQSLLVSLLIVLAGIACIIPAMVVGLVIVAIAAAGGSAPSAVILLVMIPVAGVTLAGLLFVTVRLGLAYGLLVDPDAGRPSATEALARSWRYTAGYSFELCALYVLVGLVAAASILLLCAGYVLLGAPLAAAVGGARYWLLTGDHGARYCRACGYDLTGVRSAVCPECGAPCAEPGSGTGDPPLS